MATPPVYPRLSAAHFLEIDFGSDRKAELDNGVIRMMAGGTALHALVAGNIFSFLRARLRGSGCRSYTSDMAVRTTDWSIRHPDVSIFCGPRDDPKDDEKLAFDDPKIIFEVLSKGTSRTDLRVKLEEYRGMESVDTIVVVDCVHDTIRIVQRLDPARWEDSSMTHGVDVPLLSLDLTMPNAEIFARD
jgi:Uma2 family endonuclease